MFWQCIFLFSKSDTIFTTMIVDCYYIITLMNKIDIMTDYSSSWSTAITSSWSQTQEHDGHLAGFSSSRQCSSTSFLKHNDSSFHFFPNMTSTNQVTNPCDLNAQRSHTHLLPTQRVGPHRAHFQIVSPTLAYCSMRILEITHAAQATCCRP